MSERLNQLVVLSRALGDPAHDLVILGEGNTSCQADEASFWVKASGTKLVSAAPDSFVQVHSQPVLEALDQPAQTDEQVQQLLREAAMNSTRAPSIETFLHALCLRLEGVSFVGHTHPTAAVGLLSSVCSRELFAGSLFPDQIVLLGPAFVYVPYSDPGLPLAQTVRAELDRFLDRHQRAPYVVLLENHGVIALGTTAQQVLNITHMLVKVCRVLATTLGAGGPRFLTADHVRRIDRRPDELARRADLR